MGEKNAKELTKNELDEMSAEFDQEFVADTFCKTCSVGWRNLKWLDAHVSTKQVDETEQDESIWRVRFYCPECQRRVTKFLKPA
jgi:hypothetical protein